MLMRIREILLTQYIGAIVVAFMIVDTFSSIVSAIGTIASVIYAGQKESALSEQAPRWEFAIMPIVSAVLFSTIAYALIRWLYLRDDDASTIDEQPSDPRGV